MRLVGIDHRFTVLLESQFIGVHIFQLVPNKLLWHAPIPLTVTALSTSFWKNNGKLHNTTTSLRMLLFFFNQLRIILISDSWSVLIPQDRNGLYQKRWLFCRMLSTVFQNQSRSINVANDEKFYLLLGQLNPFHYSLKRAYWNSECWQWYCVAFGDY